MTAEHLDTTPVSTPRARHESIDGLRGFAYVWVVAGHFWILVPHEATRQIPLVGWLFEAGNRGVTIFLVLAGFFAARSLMSYRGPSQTGATALWTLRRVLRVMLAVLPLLIVVVIGLFVEKPNPFPGADNTANIVAIVTQVWNVYVAQDPLAARPDLGHLWYISVYVQAILALAIVFVITRGRRALIVPLLTIALVAVTIIRSEAVEQHGMFVALVMTTTRIDGILWGALLAFFIGHLQLRGRRVDVVGLSALAMIFVLAWFATAENYFQWPGVVNNIVVCVLVTATWWATSHEAMGRIFGSRIARAIGARSLTIYIWHFPLFWLVSRYTQDWTDTERAFTGLAALIALVEFVHRQWDEPMREWINRRFPSRPRS